MENVKMSKKVVENKVTNKVENKVTINNKVYPELTLKFISELSECLWKVEEMDKLLEKAHNKPQLNTLEKSLKIRLVTMYLLIPFECKIKSVYNEKIHRLKWENSSKWDKVNKCFDDDGLQMQLDDLKDIKSELLTTCKNTTYKCLDKVKTPLLFQTYKNYCYLQAHKNKSDYEEYKKLYKIAICQYLTSNKVNPSMQLVNYICDDTNTTCLNKNISKDNTCIKQATSYEKYVVNFTYTLVQALIDYNAINVTSYLENELFANSIDDIDVKKDLKELQNIASLVD